MTHSAAPAILWFRDDLRLADNPALVAAAASKHPVLPLYILDEAGRPLGGAARWWLAGSLAALGRDLAARGARLLLRRGTAPDVLAGLIRDTGAGAVYWNERAEPKAAARDRSLAEALSARGIAVEIGAADLLAEPATGQSSSGHPLRVFAPFWRALQWQPEPPAPFAAPRRIIPYDGTVTGDALGDWRLRPTRPDWAAGIAAAWEPGEAAAQRALERFLDGALAGYAAERDRVDRATSSRLSPHLRWGEIGPRQVWHAVKARARRHAADADAFLRELAWRDFAYHLLRAEPELATKPWQPVFARFPWRDDPEALAAWQQGRTGYQLVDAAMRELWQTGWMPNRARMVVASFLAKHLLLPWQAGEAWFWDTLVDADPANNPANWQWVAGSGSDAAPYFRIFNPLTQARKFDPEGAYVRRWVPELASLSSRDIHEPGRAGGLLAAGYPAPIVEHAAARRRALDAFAEMREKAKGRR